MIGIGVTICRQSTKPRLAHKQFQVKHTQGAQFVHNSYPFRSLLTVSFGQPQHATSLKPHFPLLLLLQWVCFPPPPGAGRSWWYSPWVGGQVPLTRTANHYSADYKCEAVCPNLKVWARGILFILISLSYRKPRIIC